MKTLAKAQVGAIVRRILSSLTTGVSLLKSTADVVEYTDVDYATGSFCSSCSIPPPTAGGLWSNGKGCAMCNYDDNLRSRFLRSRGALNLRFERDLPFLMTQSTQRSSHSAESGSLALYSFSCENKSDQ